MGLITINFLLSCIFSFICVVVARRKEKNKVLWGILGFFFGLIALAVISFLIESEPAPRVNHEREEALSKGEKLLEKAQNGDAQGAFNYAEYLYGRCEYGAAAKWYEQAASQGHKAASKALDKLSI